MTPTTLSIGANQGIRMTGFKNTLFPNEIQYHWFEYYLAYDWNLPRYLFLPRNVNERCQTDIWSGWQDPPCVFCSRCTNDRSQKYPVSEWSRILLIWVLPWLRLKFTTLSVFPLECEWKMSNGHPVWMTGSSIRATYFECTPCFEWHPTSWVEHITYAQVIELHVKQNQLLIWHYSNYI